ncbi:MAG: uncharacterized protein JWP46_1226 [Modestobacter sp.]|nr:uncharacterized protein [Modestobacter sp.]
MTRRDGRRSYDGPVQLQSAPDLSAEADVVRISAAGRIWRLVSVALVLALLLVGTVWGDDSAFPFGPFRMYSTRADPNAAVVSTRVVGVTDAGAEVGLSGGEVGLRRAEFEGQLPRLEQHPPLLGLLAKSYAQRHPSAPELVSVEVVQRHFELRNGTQTGSFSDTVLVAYDLVGSS